MGQGSGGDDSTGIGDTFSREWLKHVQSYVGCTERMRRVSPGVEGTGVRARFRPPASLPSSALPRAPKG